MWNLSASSRLPLLGEVRRAEDGEPLDLAPVEQLARDQARPRSSCRCRRRRRSGAAPVELERHQQRHELVRPRLDGDPPEASGKGRRRRGREPQPHRAAAGRRRVAEVGRIRGARRTWRGHHRLELGRTPAISSSVPPSGRSTRSRRPTRAARPTRDRARGRASQAVRGFASRRVRSPEHVRMTAKISSQSSRWWKRITM